MLKIETFKCATGSGWAISEDELMNVDISYSRTEAEAIAKAEKAYPHADIIDTSNPEHFSNN